MIELTAALLGEIQRQGEQTYPDECCGILLGREHKGDKYVDALFPVENARAAGERYHRYLITAAAYLQAEKQARARDWDIIGFYHSHPDHEARPSDFDREHAWPWYSYMILNVRQRRASDLNSWVLDEDRGQFVPEQIVVKS